MESPLAGLLEGSGGRAPSFTTWGGPPSATSQPQATRTCTRTPTTNANGLARSSPRRSREKAEGPWSRKVAKTRGRISAESDHWNIRRPHFLSTRPYHCRPLSNARVGSIALRGVCPAGRDRIRFFARQSRTAAPEKHVLRPRHPTAPRRLREGTEGRRSNGPNATERVFSPSDFSCKGDPRPCFPRQGTNTAREGSYGAGGGKRGRSRKYISAARRTTTRDGKRHGEVSPGAREPRGVSSKSQLRARLSF